MPQLQSAAARKICHLLLNTSKSFSHFILGWFRKFLCCFGGGNWLLNPGFVSLAGQVTVAVLFHIPCCRAPGKLWGYQNMVWGITLHEYSKRQALGPGWGLGLLHIKFKPPIFLCVALDHTFRIVSREHLHSCFTGCQCWGGCALIRKKSSFVHRRVSVAILRENRRSTSISVEGEAQGWRGW